MALVVVGEFFQSRPVLVTGGTGFIGRRLVAALLEQGARVRTLVRGQRTGTVLAGVDVIVGDLTEPASLTPACAGVDTIFHIAGFAHADADNAPDFAARHWAVNAQGTFDLLNAARAGGVRRFVFLSTVKAVGDPGPRCVAEDWDAPPETPYGRAKRAAEERVLAVGRESGMQTVNLRPALVYGPGMQANLLRLIEAVRRSWLPPLPETGNRRSLVHVDDVVQALLLAAAHPAAAGQTYFVTDGRPYSGRELYRLIRQALGRPMPRWAIPAPVLWGAAKLADDVRGLIGRHDRKARAMLDKLLDWACYDSWRIVNELGYRPVWDLERALPGLLAGQRGMTQVNMPASPVGRLPWLLPWLIAAVLGAALTALAVLLFYRMGGLLTAAPPVQLTGTELQLTSGQGELTPNGLEIRQPGPDGRGAVQGLVQRMVQAKLFRQLSWQVEGLEPGSELRLIWVTLAEPRTLRERRLPPVGAGMVDLKTEPHWQGRIAAIGLTVRGAFASPVTVQQLELRPAPLTVGELWRWAVNEWRAFEDWSQRSINYASGAPLDALFPPVLMVALWVGFSGALYASLNPPRRRPGALLPYAALFLLGWLLLDLRWQWELNGRLERTVERFAGKEMTDRRLADLDGEFYRFLLEVRRRLPEKPVRLFIVSQDPAGFLAGRARYHLLPHNGYTGFSRPPDTAQADDYVLLLTPLPGVRYNRQEQALVWENRRLPVEIRYSAPAGALFRVRGN